MIRISSYLKYPKILEVEHLISNSFSRAIGGMFKRAFDIVSSLFGLLILSPAFIVIAICIKRDTPGPVFYHGPRAGRYGRPFDILKFRTMFECEDSYEGPRVTCKEDERITPLGHWLRDTKINELPQLLNVLKGEMSLVGPRPEDVKIAEAWPSDVRREVLSVRPGITSPASILYRDEETLLSASNLMNDYLKSILPDKIRLDRLYVRNHSFSVDLDTILWTLLVLVPKIVKARIPEGYLFAGPISRLVNRYISWFVLDFLASLGAVVTVAVIWQVREPLNNFAALAFVLALLFSGINSLVGLNRIVWSEALAEDGAWLGISAGIVTMAACGVNYLQSIYHLLPYSPLPTTMLFTIGLMASIGFVVLRYRVRLLTGLASRWLTYRQGTGRVSERVLIVGSGEGYKIANWLLKQGEASRILSIIGVVDDEEPAMQGMQVKGNMVLGGSMNLADLIKKFDIGVVLFATPNASVAFTEKITEICKAHHVRMVMLTDLLDVLQKQLTQPIKQHQTSMSAP